MRKKFDKGVELFHGGSVTNEAYPTKFLFVLGVFCFNDSGGDRYLHRNNPVG